MDVVLPERKPAFWRFIGLFLWLAFRTAWGGADLLLTIPAVLSWLLLVANLKQEAAAVLNLPADFPRLVLYLTLIWAVVALARAAYSLFSKLYDERDSLRASLEGATGKIKAYFRLIPRKNTAEKNYLAQSPTDLEMLFRNRSDKEIEDLAKPFKGLWWAFEGVISHRYSQNTVIWNIAKCAPAEPEITIDFDHTFRGYAWQCHAGRQIRVEGKIESINMTHIWVSGCKPVT